MVSVSARNCWASAPSSIPITDIPTSARPVVHGVADGEQLAVDLLEGLLRDDSARTLLLEASVPARQRGEDCVVTELRQDVTLGKLPTGLCNFFAVISQVSSKETTPKSAMPVGRLNRSCLIPQC